MTCTNTFDRYFNSKDKIFDPVVQKQSFTLSSSNFENDKLAIQPLNIYFNPLEVLLFKILTWQMFTNYKHVEIVRQKSACENQ